MKTIYPESRLRELVSDAWDAFKSTELIEVLIIMVILALVGSCALGVYRDHYIRRPAAFAAWTKLTGNPRHLTYEEWNDLTRVMNHPE